MANEMESAGERARADAMAEVIYTNDVSNLIAPSWQCAEQSIAERSHGHGSDVFSACVSVGGLHGYMLNAEHKLC